jgi:hypothetical protein
MHPLRVCTPPPPRPLLYVQQLLQVSRRMPSSHATKQTPPLPATVLAGAS